MSTGPAQLTQELAAEWRERAACSGYRHTLFFPVGDTDAATIDRQHAERPPARRHDAVKAGVRIRDRAGLPAEQHAARKGKRCRRH